ncbi:MAG: hypothetical protein M0R80_17440 [Proteobacteria bacterium]|jgi:hypothetical protein|nr:hypothetical protein [Pseudomonadota bacterium]
MYTETSETYQQATATPSAFIGGTANARGDFDGTGNPLTLFTVTGTVAMKLFGRCTVDLAGAGGTVQIGTALSTAALIALTTGTDIKANELWHDATPDASIELSSVLTEKIVNQNVIETVATANISSGNIQYVCLWRAITPGATVTGVN